MTDPCWLPSAIMQTLGAMYGIFIVVYILILQYKVKYNIHTQKPSEFIDLVKTEEKYSINWFFVISLLTFTTILINAVVLYNTTINFFPESKSMFQLCLISFIFSISGIVVFSSVLVNSFMHKKKSEEIYEKYKKNEDTEK